MQCRTCGDHGNLSLLDPEHASLLPQLAAGCSVCHDCVVEIKHWSNFLHTFQTSQTRFQQVLHTQQTDVDPPLERNLPKCQVLVAKLLECDFCCFYSDNKTQLASHMQTHLPENASERTQKRPANKKRKLKSVKCEQCDIAYYRPEMLAWHTENCHGADAIVKVIKISDKMGNYQCKFCKTVFTDQSLIVYHLHSQHGIKNLPYQCRSCKRQFVSGSGMKCHQNVCKNIRRCSHCHVVMHHHETLAWHMKFCHGPDKIVKIINSGNGRKFQCVFCKIEHDSLPKIIFHLSAKHKLRNYPYHCEKCGKPFVITHTLLKHQLACKGSKNVENVIEKIGVKCHLCNEVFKSEKYMRSHISKIHARIPSVDCRYCDQSFASNKQLFKHCYNNHRGKPILECEICNLEFASYNGYFEHKKFKHGDMIISCKICSKNFTYPEALKKHVDRTHSNAKKTFSCHICSASFICKQYLTKHIEGLHTGKILRCFHCNYSTRTKIYLVYHLKRTHYSKKKRSRTK